MNTLPFSDLDPLQFDESDRFDVWRDSVSPLFDSLPSRASDDVAFDVKARLFLSSQCIFSNTSFNEQRFLRDARWCEMHDPDHILVQLYTKGGYVGRNGHREITVEAGDIALLDLGYTLSTSAATSNVITLVLPRRVVIDYCGPDGLAHGYVIPRDTPLAKFMAGQMALMWSQLHSLEASVAEIALKSLAQSFMDYFRLAQNGQNNPENIHQSVQLDNCKVFVENHLANPNLSVNFICQQLGLSRSSVYRVFQSEGGVAAYILRRRLFRCYKELAYGKSAKVLETALRWGFSDHSHFTKCFKREFNLTPSEVLEQSLSESFTRTEAAKVCAEMPEYQRWLAQL